MEWFAKAAGQSVNNLKFNPIAPEEMASYNTPNVYESSDRKVEVVT